MKKRKTFTLRREKENEKENSHSPKFHQDINPFQDK